MEILTWIIHKPDTKVTPEGVLKIKLLTNRRSGYWRTQRFKFEKFGSL